MRPLNATHVQLGVKPPADKVEVVELKYQYKGRWIDVPVARLTADRAVWLNTTDGRPVTVPCSANVTVATRYGTASRAVSFTPVCLQRQPQIVDDLTVLLEQMVSYGSYVLDYVAYKSTPVLTAYFAFGSLHIGFQNVGPFPYMAVGDALTGAGLWPPSVRALVLTPGKNESVAGIPFACDFHNGVCGVMHRWMNIYVYWSDTLEIWINNVRVYNGTPPQRATEFTTPQGFKVVFDPGKNILTVKYPSVNREWRTALNLSVSRGATQWWGWVKMINVPGPASRFAKYQTWYVMPAGPYAGRVGGFELFGVVPPFEVYSIYAAVNGSGLVARVGDPNCGLSEKCIRTFFYPQPGAYRIDTGINTPAGVLVYMDNNYLIAVTSTFRRAYCGGGGPFARCATISWYVPGISWAVFIHYGRHATTESWQVGSGPYRCIIRTDGFRNTVAFEGRYWQIECGIGWPPHWQQYLGSVRLVFNRDYTISVYKDGQHLYNVPVYVCAGPVATCGWGPWAPTQRLTIPVSWDTRGVAVGIAQYRHNKHSIGYGEGLIHVQNVQTVALPYYYKYDLTGAYPYRLEVKIDTVEREITRVGNWRYVNVTYSGYLKLYLGDKLVAYDALYGWTIRRDYVPPHVPPPPPEYEHYEPSKPSSTCVPQRVRKPKGLEHRNLQQSGGGYSVEVYRVYEVREFGCGVSRTYEERILVRVITTTGTSYHTRDPKGRVCGFRQARDCRGVVYCDKCPGE